MVTFASFVTEEVQLGGHVMKLFNAFSLSFMGSITHVTFEVREVTSSESRDLLSEDLESFIGHQDTAEILSRELGLLVPVNRQKAEVRDGESFIVAQYIGPRLPEGTTVLPKDAHIKFYLCTMRSLNGN